MFEKLQFPVKLMDLPHPIHAMSNIKGRKAIVREDTGHVLNIVSNRYQLVPHLDVFSRMNEAVERVGVPVKSVEVGTGDFGGSALVTWRLDRQVKIGANDMVDLQVMGRNSYNYTSMVNLSLGGFRIVCSNGLVVGHLLARSAKRHVPSLKVEVLIAEISAMLAQTEQVAAAWAAWDAIEYTAGRFSAWLEKQTQVSKKARDQVLDYFQLQPDNRRFGISPRMTGWEAYNSLTWFGTHRLRTRTAERVLVAREFIDNLADQFAMAELSN